MNSNTKEHFELGKKRYYRYDRKGAEEAFREALSSEPNDPTALGWLAITLAQQGKHDGAIEVINQFDGRDVAEICIARGIISDDRDGNKQDALDHYSKAISLDHNNELGFAVRGLAYSQIKKEPEAISDMENALKVNPSAYVYIIFGGVKIRFKYKQEALSLYEKAAKIDPENSRAWNNIASTRFKIGDYNQALIDFNKAIELDPNYVSAIIVRGNLKFHNLSDNQGALEDYSKVIEIDPEYKTAWARRAHLQTALGKYQDALGDYDKAIKLDPNYVWVLYKRGELKHVFLDDNQGALADYTRVIKLDSKYQAAWAARASLLAEIGNYKDALVDYDKAIELDPSDVWALDKRGDLKRVSLNDNESALVDYNKAIEIDPGYKFAWASRGVLKKEMGDSNGALSDLTKALEIDRDFCWALAQRAILFKSLGQHEFSLADHSRCYELEGIPNQRFKDSDDQDIYDTVHKYLEELTLPELKETGERLIEFWECLFYWGKEDHQSIHKGGASTAHYGKYGMGYLCMSERNLRIISIGSLSKKYAKKIELGRWAKLGFALLGQIDFRSISKEDQVWTIPFKDIQSVVKEKNKFHLVTGSETWQMFPLWINSEYFQSALELARSGNLRKIIDIEKLKIQPKPVGSEDEIFDKIERLASMKEKGIITHEEFEQKKKELLARI